MYGSRVRPHKPCLVATLVGTGAHACSRRLSGGIACHACMFARQFISKLCRNRWVSSRNTFLRQHRPIAGADAAGHVEGIHQFRVPCLQLPGPCRMREGHAHLHPHVAQSSLELDEVIGELDAGILEVVHDVIQGPVLPQLKTPDSGLSLRTGAGRKGQHHGSKGTTPFSGETKVRILRQHLLDGKPISEVSEQHGISLGMFYPWQKAFFENGARAFEGGGPGGRTTDAEKRVQDLEQRLQRKHEAISDLMEGHIRLKRTWGVGSPMTSER